MKIVVDIDQTLIYTNIVRGEYVATGINNDLIDRLNNLSAEGHDIIVCTGRSWKHYDATIRQLDNIHLSYDNLIMGKPPADYYIDDKGITAENFLELIF